MKFFATLALLAGLLSCSNSSENNSNTSESIMPLAVGNQWTMTSAFNGEVYESTMMLGDSKDIEGDKWFQVKRIEEDGEQLTQMYYSNQNDGLYAGGYNESQKFENFLVFKYPCKTGDTWTVNGTIVTVIKMDKEITVEAGTFKTIQYQGKDDDGDEIDIFVAPGVGIIKDNYSELKAYKLK